MTPLEIHSKLKESKEINSIMSVHIDNALIVCPNEVIYYLAEKCTFVYCERMGRPCVIPISNHVKNGVDYFIFLPCKLLEKPDETKKDFILHEVAHAYLGHKGEKTIQEEDKEADELVKVWVDI